MRVCIYNAAQAFRAYGREKMKIEPPGLLEFCRATVYSAMRIIMHSLMSCICMCNFITPELSDLSCVLTRICNRPIEFPHLMIIRSLQWRPIYSLKCCHWLCAAYQLKSTLCSGKRVPFETSVRWMIHKTSPAEHVDAIHVSFDSHTHTHAYWSEVVVM